MLMAFYFTGYDFCDMNVTSMLAFNLRVYERVPPRRLPPAGLDPAPTARRTVLLA